MVPQMTTRNAKEGQAMEIWGIPEVLEFTRFLLRRRISGWPDPKSARVTLEHLKEPWGQLPELHDRLAEARALRAHRLAA